MPHFDYVTMHHRWRRLFSRIRSEVGTHLDCDVAGPKIKDLGTSEMMLPAIVASILHQNQMDRIDIGRNAATLAKVGKILKDIVEREGEEETKKLDLEGKRHGWLAKGI